MAGRLLLVLFAILVGSYGYVPDGNAFFLKEVTQKTGEVLEINGITDMAYNWGVVKLYLIKPNLTIQWYLSHWTDFGAWDELISPGSMDFGTPVTMIEKSNYDLITTSLVKQIKELQTHMKEINVMIRSKDANFIYKVGGISFETDRPADPKDEPPWPREQYYVTKIAPPVARLSEGKHAEVVAEFWRFARPPIFEIYFTKSQNPDERFQIYGLHFQFDVVEVEGVTVNVEETQEEGLYKYSITVQTQTPGLLLIDAASFDGVRMTMYTECLDNSQQSWLDEAGYDVQFKWPEEDYTELEGDQSFVVVCDARGPDVRPEIMFLEKDGSESILADVSYISWAPGYIRALYEGSGTEEGHFTCSVYDTINREIKTVSTFIARN